jgi:hypothetical protein
MNTEVRTALAVIVQRRMNDPLVAEAARRLGEELARAREMAWRADLIAKGGGGDARVACYIRDGHWPDNEET